MTLATAHRRRHGVHPCSQAESHNSASVKRFSMFSLCSHFSNIARASVAAFLWIAVTGCDGLPQTYTSSEKSKLDAADVNARNAIGRQREIIDRLDRLEQRADQVEAAR